MTAPRRIRVLVADDSAVARASVRRALERALDIEVVGTAANGRDAVALAAQLAPDAVVLDVEMPQLDGLAALRAIKAARPSTVVIMFSALTTAGARVTIEALAQGASDFLPKPTAGHVADTFDQLETALQGRLRALCRPRPAPTVVRRAPPPPPSATRVEAIVVAVSTGGPLALAALLPRLPSRLPVPVLIVQHLPAAFTPVLAERLAATSALPVVLARDGETVRAGHVYLAPGDGHLTVTRRRGVIVTTLVDGPPEHSCRPAADPLFRSAATIWRGGVLALVLTGMGCDGTPGAAAIRAAGGRVWAQDQASSAVWGMPGAVVEADLAERVVPLTALASAIALAVPERSASVAAADAAVTSRITRPSETSR